MTALIAPPRATSFEGLIFFVYDREAVTKEADPPENAIVYFYPPSASIEDRISICGQLIGMSYFIHGFIGSRPALCKLQREKVATVQSGRYTLALGGSLGEPDSLLIRQLETLHSLFTFYHGSLDRIRMMCKNQKQFLSWMNVIWDCYLHFVRHYGDFLPGVFDPLPFLDLPKRVAATCFTKASYILQACQRRKHILGGCILYSNSILCTQLEPSITERLILLKPNQSNHPARPVKTEHALPFGVRILNAFLSLSEYLNLYDALAESAYRQPDSPECTGAFPDMYMTSPTSAANRNSSRDASGDKLQHGSSDASSSERSDRGSTERGNEGRGNAASAMPLDTVGGVVLCAEKEGKDSENVSQRERDVKHDTERSSKKERRVEDVESSDQGSRKPNQKQRAKDESSLLLGKTKSRAEVSDETERSNEHGIEGAKASVEQNERPETEACVFPAEKKTGEKHSESETLLTKKKTQEEQNGSEATALLAEKKPGKEQNGSEASALLTEKKPGEEQNGSEASAFVAGKRTGEEQNESGASEQNESETSDLIAENTIGEEQSGSKASDLIAEKNTKEEILDKTGHNAVDEVDAVTNSSTAFDNSSCESTSCNNVSLTSESIDIPGLKVARNYGTAFDSSSCESSSSKDVSLTMDAIDVSGLRVIESSSSLFRELLYYGGDMKNDKIIPCSSSNDSICRTGKSPEKKDIEICKVVLEELITQVCEIVENKNPYLDSERVQCDTASGACCQTCAEAQKSRDSCAEAQKSRDVSGQNTKVQENGCETESDAICSKTDPPSDEQHLGKKSVNRQSDVQGRKLLSSNRQETEGASRSRQPETSDSAENGVITDANSSQNHSLRSDFIKTPIVCDSFSVRNLNSRSPEKFLGEKSFTCNDTEILESEKHDSASENGNATCSTEVEDGRPVAASEVQKTEGNASHKAISNAFCITGVEDRMPAVMSGIREAERNASGNAKSDTACRAEVEGRNPVTASLLSIEYDSEIHIANGHEGTPPAEGIGTPVDTALEEMEDGSPHDQSCEPPLPSHPDLHEEEELLFEDEGDDLNQVEGLTHVNLYVQAHSKVVLILLAEEGLNTDSNSIKALWETSLNQLGELEFLVKESFGDETTTPHSDEYSFLVYDGFERTMKGNLDELVHQVDHLFCETTKVLYEQFENCSTLKDVLLRDRSSTVYGKRNLGRGTYFHLKGPCRTPQGVPSHRDPSLKLEKRATKVLNKEHGVNVF